MDLKTILSLLAFQLSKGTWPSYSESRLVLISAMTGKVVQERDFGVFSSGSPLVVDVDGDGKPEVIATTNLEAGFDQTAKGELGIFSVPELTAVKRFPWSGFSASTPWAGDLDNNGLMDLVFAYHGKVKRIEVSGSHDKRPFRVFWGQFRGEDFDGRFKQME